MNTHDTCPRFEACGANVCPLDSDWSKRVHLRREAVCALMLEGAKAGGPELLRSKVPAIAESVLTASPLIAAKHPDIAARLTRAAGSRSRIAAAEVARAGVAKAA